MSHASSLRCHLPHQVRSRSDQNAIACRLPLSIAFNAFNGYDGCMKRRPLIKRNTPCGYCFERWAKIWDCFLAENGEFYPACLRCNSMLKHRKFSTIEEKRDYARKILIESEQWRGTMPDMQADIQEKSASGLLHAEVSLGSVAPKKNRGV